MAKGKYQVSSHRNGEIKIEGSANTFDAALVMFFKVHPSWAKIIVKIPDALCVKSFGRKRQVDELKTQNHCSKTSLGGKSQKYEVYWHVVGGVLHQLADSLEDAVTMTDVIGGDHAHIVVKSKDNRCVKKFGDEAFVKKLIAMTSR